MGGQTKWLLSAWEEKAKSNATDSIVFAMVESKARGHCVNLCANIGR